MKLKRLWKNGRHSIKGCAKPHDRCQLSSAAKINDFPNKDQHVAYIQDRLHEDEQYIQKIEIINEEDIKTWVSQDSVNKYVLEYLYRLPPTIVTNVET